MEEWYRPHQRWGRTAVPPRPAWKKGQGGSRQWFPFVDPNIQQIIIAGEYQEQKLEAMTRSEQKGFSGKSLHINQPYMADKVCINSEQNQYA
jgi:hypothetical protein